MNKFVDESGSINYGLCQVFLRCFRDPTGP